LPTCAIICTIIWFVFHFLDLIRHVYANNISGIQTSYKFIMHLKMKHKMKQNIDIFMPLNIDNCQVFVYIVYHYNKHVDI
jgi:hypothetical protein